MKLLHKLLALLLLTSVLPLTAVSVLLIDIGRREVQSTVRHVHQLEADAAAVRVREFLNEAADRLVADLEGGIDTMEDEEIRDALIWMFSKQDTMILFRVFQVHGPDGAPITPAIHLPEESIPPDLRDDFLVLPEDLDEFDATIPVAAALISGATEISPVTYHARRREAIVAISVPIVDQFHGAKWVVSGQLSLRQVQRQVSDVTFGSFGFAYLVDGDGRAIAHPRFDLVRDGADLSGGMAAGALGSRSTEAKSYTDAEGKEHLGAHAPVRWGGWQLLVEQPAADAYRPVREMRSRAAFILVVALLASLGCGMLYVRGLVGPLRRVMAGMRRIVDGEFDQRLSVRTGDEVGELANAFNVMGRMLASYRSEVESWNDELQDRVAAKTEALERAQAQLIQSAKLSSLGQLGAGIAHELNNPLTGVVGQAVLLKRRIQKLDLPENERGRLERYVEHVERESARCRDIIHGLLSFSQQAGGGHESVDVNERIKTLLVLLDNQARSGRVTLEKDLGEEIPSVPANAQQVQQVLMHLMSNAFQAMPDGGTARLSTRADGTGVIVEVSDTGRGIPPEHVDRVFDPFFTTKDVWDNTGLGLSVCYSIVEGHGGSIEIDSELGRGTTVRIRLPGSHAAENLPEIEPVGLGSEEATLARRQAAPTAEPAGAAPTSTR